MLFGYGPWEFFLFQCQKYGLFFGTNRDIIRGDIELYQQKVNQGKTKSMRKSFIICMHQNPYIKHWYFLQISSSHINLNILPAVNVTEIRYQSERPSNNC